ncbi:hypothetical protein F5887DRAFT_156695 [Amanita rubescens]|nr:hypothetical protein F5887DRAFT_156695 [Amanita rubescens]
MITEASKKGEIHLRATCTIRPDCCQMQCFFQYVYARHIWRIFLSVWRLRVQRPHVDHTTCRGLTLIIRLPNPSTFCPAPEIPRAASRGADADLIATHLGKYVVPASIVNAKRSIAGNSRTAAKRIFRSRDDHPSVTRKSDQKQSIEIPSELTVGSYYDPHLLPNFGGPVFRLVNAKLMQREVVDIDRNLVPPWETTSFVSELWY